MVSYSTMHHDDQYSLMAALHYELELVVNFHYELELVVNRCC